MTTYGIGRHQNTAIHLSVVVLHTVYAETDNIKK